MPLWACVLVVVAVALAVMAVWDRRTRARGAGLNDLGAMARGVRQAEADPEEYRGRDAAPGRGRRGPWVVSGPVS